MAEPLVRKNVPISPDLYKRIVNFRYSNRLPSDAEAFRVLMRMGLDQQQACVAQKSDK